MTSERFRRELTIAASKPHAPQMGSHAREILVVNINDNLPHSRPNRATLLIALGLILGVAVIVFWPQISAFAHISEIRNALGL